MHGNVYEWCKDWHGDYPTGHVTDPIGPISGEIRVLRGGSCDNGAWLVRSAYRFGNPPLIRFNRFGFRVARAL